MRRIICTLLLSIGASVVARAQSLAPSAVRPTTHSDNVIRMKAALRTLVASQERYWQQHGSYTSDMAALGIYSPDVPASRDSAWVQVIFAGSRGWTGMASIPSQRPNRATCVIFVGPAEDLPKLPQSHLDKKTPEAEGAPVCDGDPTSR
jgi:hypothetical protein